MNAEKQQITRYKLQNLGASMLSNRQWGNVREDYSFDGKYLGSNWS